MAHYLFIHTFQSAASTGQIIQINDIVDINNVQLCATAFAIILLFIYSHTHTHSVPHDVCKISGCYYMSHFE
jgi:hypothetical protein